MRIHKKIGTKDRLFEMFENVNKIKLNEAFDNKTLSVKDWNEYNNGDIEITFSDGRIENFSYYDDEDNGSALDYHTSGLASDNVGVLLYTNDDNSLIAKFEAISLTNNPDNPEWEINNILEVEPFQQQTNEAYDESYVDPLAAARTQGEQSNRNSEFARLSANNFQPFKDEYGIPDDIFNRMSDDEKRKELVDYLSISESVNSLKEDNKLIKPIIPQAINLLSKKDNIIKFNNKEDYNKFIENQNYFSASHSHSFYSDDEHENWLRNNTYNDINSKESDILFNVGDLVGVWDNKNSIGLATPNVGSSNQIKEDINNEVGTDSGIFQMLLAYVTKNRITEVEFQVGELTVQIIANPTTWDESPYMGATRMQPEEGGYPENVQGEISDIVIWDREDNEYTLSSDALQRLNQNVSFDGNVLEDITEKAANGGSEDEYSRADFNRKSGLENEGVIKEDGEIERQITSNGLTPNNQKFDVDDYIKKNPNLNIIKKEQPKKSEPFPTYANNGLKQGKNRAERRKFGDTPNFSKDIRGKLKEDESSNVAQEIYDELEMRYSPSTRTISHDEIMDVANLYDAQPEDVAQVASEVISNAIDITVDVEDFIEYLQQNNFDYANKPTVTIWEMFEKEYEEGSTFGEFRSIWDKLVKDPNQTNMFETSYTDLTKKTGVDMMEGIRFNYDQKGNWIPEGYEDKRIALRPLEQPFGSDNWKVALVTLDVNGDLDDIVKVTDTWEEGKNALHASIT